VEIDPGAVVLPPGRDVAVAGDRTGALGDQPAILLTPLDGAGQRGAQRLQGAPVVSIVVGIDAIDGGAGLVDGAEPLGVLGAQDGAERETRKARKGS
jgi:hypothetical protein